MPKVDLAAIPEDNSTRYLPPYDAIMAKRFNRRIGRTTGLTDFGVNQVRVAPGGISSARHWHEGEDEFVVILSGHAVLVDDHGRTPAGPGDCFVFTKNDGNGHQFVNEGDADCVMIAVGGASVSPCHYPDADMALVPGRGFVRKSEV